MCFIPPTGKKKGPSKPGPKVSLEGARIILGSDGARLSFSATSKLPSNLFVRQDFYGADKTPLQAPPLSGTASAQVYCQYTTQSTGPVQSQAWAQYGSPLALETALTPPPQNN
jgi:hypothetical protein